MRIATIGTGMVGGALAKLWRAAGHEVMISSRHPERLEALAAEIDLATGSVDDAAEWAEAVLLAIPFAVTETVGREQGPRLAGKVLLDAGNIIPQRDGAVVAEVTAAGQGSAAYTQRCFDAARVVKAFNTVYFRVMETEAHRDGDRVGIPLAGDDADALEIAARLVRDAGYDPVVVGGLTTAARFDHGTPVWNSSLSGPEVRQALGV